MEDNHGGVLHGALAALGAWREGKAGAITRLQRGRTGVSTIRYRL